MKNITIIDHNKSESFIYRLNDDLVSLLEKEEQSFIELIEQETGHDLANCDWAICDDFSIIKL